MLDALTHDYMWQMTVSETYTVNDTAQLFQTLLNRHLWAPRDLVFVVPAWIEHAICTAQPCASSGSVVERQWLLRLDRDGRPVGDAALAPI